MAEDSDMRSGEDRRVGGVSHETLYSKQLEHDDQISEIRGDLSKLTDVVTVISDELKPISSGITSMVFLFKLLLAMGALSAAFLGMMELWVHFKGEL